MAAEATAKKPQLPVLMPERMGLVGQKQNVFVVDIPMSVTLEQLLEPSYWAHVAEQMQPLDEIKARMEDGSAVHYLLVGWCERNFAHVKLDRTVTLNVSKEPPVSSVKHRVQWMGMHQKYCVIRQSDNAILREGETKDGAARWLREYESGLGR